MILMILMVLLSVIFIFWATTHSNLFKCLLWTEKCVAYGVYSTIWEMIFYHYYFLFATKLLGGDRDTLINDICNKFRSLLNDRLNGSVLITHSCRTIFVCIIKTLMAQKEEKGDNTPLRICCCSMQFGSFYRLLRALELKIEFYEIDLKLSDWTLDESQINEHEMSKCDLILCQHLFGVPFDQHLLFKLGNKLGIPILEDCVQSGSLFSKYKGHKLADIAIWSCGFDKTPSCFGGGLGYFYDTKHGNALYHCVRSMHDSFKVDSFKDRFMGLLNQTIHLIVTRNHFCVIYGLGVAFYLFKYRPGVIKWYEIALAFRKAKSITPFQHKSSVFLSKPSMAQLRSIRYGLSKSYDQIIENEIRNRDFFLSKIPERYHSILFPFLTDKFKKKLRSNRGIAEFTWVYSADNDRIQLNDYIQDTLITMINTTWVTNEETKLEPNNSAFICNNLTYLPNINEMSDIQMIKCAQVLTNYCKHKEY